MEGNLKTIGIKTGISSKVTCTPPSDVRAVPYMVTDGEGKGYSIVTHSWSL